ncbi:triacylglycerol lipase [Pyricularia oryzae]|nr:triacylglycerol lipase [Pyricularia oryzae]KAI7928703.1 triacylglycerol lipase [Pyricularia oryzae]
MDIDTLPLVSFSCNNYRREKCRYPQAKTNAEHGEAYVGMISGDARCKLPTFLRIEPDLCLHFTGLFLSG